MPVTQAFGYSIRLRLKETASARSVRVPFLDGDQQAGCSAVSLGCPRVTVGVFLRLRPQWSTTRSKMNGCPYGGCVRYAGPKNGLASLAPPLTDRGFPTSDVRDREHGVCGLPSLLGNPA
ncbi:hypothetical protein Trydic_g11523 [Trypoxylus dichotomus]